MERPDVQPDGSGGYFALGWWSPAAFMSCLVAVDPDLIYWGWCFLGADGKYRPTVPHDPQSMMCTVWTEHKRPDLFMTVYPADQAHGVAFGTHPSPNFLDQTPIADGLPAGFQDAVYVNTEIRFGFWDRIRVLLRGVVYLRNTTYTQYWCGNTRSDTAQVTVAPVFRQREQEVVLSNGGHDVPRS